MDGYWSNWTALRLKVNWTVLWVEIRGLKSVKWTVRINRRLEFEVLKWTVQQCKSERSRIFEAPVPVPKVVADLLVFVHGIRGW